MALNSLMDVSHLPTCNLYLNLQGLYRACSTCYDRMEMKNSKFKMSRMYKVYRLARASLWNSNLNFEKPSTATAKNKSNQLSSFSLGSIQTVSIDKIYDTTIDSLFSSLESLSVF